MRLAFTITALFIQITAANAQALPIPDGAYLREASQCQVLAAGELDFIDLEVTNSSHSYSYPEVGCQVASIESVRDGRYSVVGDCNEFGEIWQDLFFLDVLADGSVRLNGEPHYMCSISNVPSDASMKVREWGPFYSSPEGTLCEFRVARYAPQYWFLDENDDDQNLDDLDEIEGPPVGSEVFLLNTQNTSLQTLGGKDLVFVFKGYFAEADSLEFVGNCGSSR